MIIDTHTHFYDPTRAAGVPWPPKEDRLLYRKVMPADYQALPQPRQVNGTVVVEASPWLEDNQWILDLAATDPFILGFVGHLPATSNEFPAHLDRFGASPLFRGIRISGNQLRDAFDAILPNLRRLAERGLALDLLGNPDMLPLAARLAQTLPGLRIMIDHLANVRIDGRSPPSAWSSGVQAVSRHPNVFCKLSGLVEGTGKTDRNAPVEIDFYRPVLDAAWKGFGEDRLVYGSNWPVSERFASCATVQSLVATYFGSKGREQVDKVFWRNAKAFYRWTAR